ncbi:hypothetical protein HELRODRAFT_188606 [Helobdella robusta]|uniref:Transmembrane protein 45B n=1 Tax=Helobdella robusta TaxID=6412 RepID=T1FQ63_HELRO|nr:hypothetical protein HELRODRAFT_188606 [Helobdella robusta]ESO02169.1 hypothetical protein HELRODRAFT_188606 [Helobdella robusta]
MNNSLIGEIFSEGVKFLDEEGNFLKVAQMQHMSIYTIFITHGIIDILMSYRLPLFKGADYISASLAFFWFGYSFSFHAHMHDKAMLETAIHVLPIPIMYIVSLLALVEMLFPCFIQISVLRCIAVMLLGTWLIQASFVMYLPYPLPGSSLNPRWNQLDDRNVHAIVASFGFHIILSIVITILIYAAVYSYLKVKNKLPYAFQPIRNVDDNDVTGNNGCVTASQSKSLLDDDDVV